MPLSTEDLIDRLYEAAIIPDLWPSVLGDVASTVDGAGCALFSFRPDRMQWVGSPVMADLLADFASLGRPELNIRSPRGLASSHVGFLTDYELVTEEEIETHPFYTEFLRPRGFGWCAGTTVSVPSGDKLLYSIERRYDRGPFSPNEVSRLDELRPHLARSAFLSGRLALERARAAAEMLGLIGLPGAVLSQSRRVLAANTLFEKLIPHVVQDGRERVLLCDAAADRLLLRAFREPHGVRSIPVPASDARAPMIVHLIPVRGRARDVFSLASDVLVITPVSQAEVPSADVVQGLFDLTPAEARVAQAVGGGKTLEDIAVTSGVSVGTVRSQLKAVFTKTGLSRQADLVSLLSGLALPRR